MVRDWVKNRWSKDLRGVVETPPNVPTIMLRGVFGVRVTLRQAGALGFAGDAYEENLDRFVDAQGDVADVGKLARDATLQALVKLDREARRMYDKEQADRKDVQLPPYELSNALKDLLVDVQIGHHLESIQLPASAPMNELQTRFSSGFHGLRLVAGDGPGTFVWPATALAQNLRPDAQLFQLMSGQGVPLQDLPRLARTGGPRLQRFEVMHVADPAVAMEAIRLVRGGTELPATAVNRETLESLAARVTSHMLRGFTGEGGVRGTYLPSEDRYDPRPATPREAALACYALVRAMGRGDARPDPDDPDLQTVMRAALRVARQEVGAGRNTPEAVDLPAVALALLTLVDSPVAHGEDELRDALGMLLLSMYQKGDGFRETAAPGARLAHLAQSAMATAAVAAWFEQTRRPEAGEVASDALDTLWLNAGRADPMVSLLPWYTLAHTRAAHLLDAGQNPDAITQRERRLVEVLAEVCRAQVLSVPQGDPTDTVGGFALGDPPQVAWHSAYPLWFLAQALKDPDLTRQGQVTDWLSTARFASRFIGQLMISETAGFYLRHPDEAKGGIRLALWDNRLAIEPNAYALLAITTLIEAVDGIEQRRDSTPSPDAADDDPSSAAGE